MNGTILAVESSGEGGGAAVLRNGEVVTEREVSGARRHGSELMPCIDSALAGAGVPRERIDAIAVNVGPGSYTGLRIGIATAQSIGFALGKPVVAVPCLDAMALQYVMGDAFDVSLKRELWPVLDARRDEVMTARFEYDNGELVRAGGDVLLDAAGLQEQAREQAIIFGSGVPAVAEAKSGSAFLDDAAFELKPSSIALQAFRQLANVDPSKIEHKPVEPRYFRRVLAKTIAERALDVK